MQKTHYYCDRCGKECKQEELTKVNPQYQDSGVWMGGKELCPECLNVFKKEFAKLLRFINDDFSAGQVEFGTTEDCFIVGDDEGHAVHFTKKRYEKEPCVICGKPTEFEMFESNDGGAGGEVRICGNCLRDKIYDNNFYSHINKKGE